MQQGNPKFTPDWRQWRNLFVHRRGRPRPDQFADEPQLASIPKSVARSLVVFQLGESRGGTIVEYSLRSPIAEIDACYAEAMELFVAEEHHHAELLACAVRMLGGELIRENWTAKLFVWGRRLIGLRLKVMVLLAAEVVGICYYHLLATKLPESRLKSLLEKLVDDELSHLDFHCSFLRTQTGSAWRRAIFVAAWRALSVAAAATVLVDHRHALRDLGIPARVAWRRWMSVSRHAEALACPRHDGRLGELRVG